MHITNAAVKNIRSPEVHNINGRLLREFSAQCKTIKKADGFPSAFYVYLKYFTPAEKSG